MRLRWSHFYAPSAWALLPIQHWTEPSGARCGWSKARHPHGGCAGGLRWRQPPRPCGKIWPGQRRGADGARASRAAKKGGRQPPWTKTPWAKAWADLGAGFEAGRQRPLRYSLRSLTDARPAGPRRPPGRPPDGRAQLAADIWARDRARWSASLREAATRPVHRGGRSLCRRRVRQPPLRPAHHARNAGAHFVDDMQRFHAKRWPPAAPA